MEREALVECLCFGVLFICLAYSESRISNVEILNDGCNDCNASRVKSQLRDSPIVSKNWVAPVRGLVVAVITLSFFLS